MLLVATAEQVAQVNLAVLVTVKWIVATRLWLLVLRLLVLRRLWLAATGEQIVQTHATIMVTVKWVVAAPLWLLHLRLLWLTAEEATEHPTQLWQAAHQEAKDQAGDQARLLAAEVGLLTEQTAEQTHILLWLAGCEVEAASGRVVAANLSEQGGRLW